MNGVVSYLIVIWRFKIRGLRFGVLYLHMGFLFLTTIIKIPKFALVSKQLNHMWQFH
jgi:hypothetical protein